MKTTPTNYDVILDALFSERTRIAAEIESIESFLSKEPQSNIRARNRNGNWYFTEAYPEHFPAESASVESTQHHTAASASNHTKAPAPASPRTPEHYIPASDSYKIKLLNSKHYAHQILPQLRRDLKIIDYMIAHYHPDRRAQIYAKLPAGRRLYISPLYQPIEELVADFNAEVIPPYIHGGAISAPHPTIHGSAQKAAPSSARPNISTAPTDPTAIYRTARGEMVRSKSELLIANELNKRGIPYHYEEAITLAAPGAKYPDSTYHPDFVALNPRTGQKYIWEHFGRMGDPTYATDKVGRIKRYIQNGYIPGINRITTFEAESQPLTTDIINAMIDAFLA